MAIQKTHGRMFEDGSLTENDIADGAVTVNKIPNGEITDVKLAAGIIIIEYTP